MRKNDVMKKVENRVENIVSGATGAVTGALDSRSNSVTVRLDAESAKSLDKLVEAELVKDRGGAALFLVKEGIKARSDLYDKIDAGFDRIQTVKQELRSLESGVAEDAAPAASE